MAFYRVATSTRLLPSRIPLRTIRYSRRFDSSKASPAAAGGGLGAVTGGVVGGLVTLGIGYGVYHFSGARSTINTLDYTKKQFESALKKTTESAPEPDQAIQWLRNAVGQYAGIIPGVQQYVDTAFDELETIKKEHGAEADKIVKETYNDLRKVSDKGVSTQTLTEVLGILQTAAKRIKDLAGDVGKDLLDQNPQLKEKFNGNFEELQKMGDKYGPQAKKEVEETWGQVQDIVKGGLGVKSFDQIRELLESKIGKVQELGDEYWKKGMKQAQPYLEKSPKVKEFLDKNKDALKGTNLDDLWQKVKEAAQSGDVSNLEKMIKDKAGQVQQSFGGKGMEQYLEMIPGGKEVGGKLRQLYELSEKHGDKAEDLLKDAFEEVKGVLQKKVDEGQKLADEVKKDAK